MKKPKPPEDGLGWWSDYVSTLMMSYPQFSLDFVLWELDMVEGWWWWSCAYQKFGSAMWVTKMVRGYIARETENLVKQQKEYMEHGSQV